MPKTSTYCYQRHQKLLSYKNLCHHLLASGTFVGLCMIHLEYSVTSAQFPAKLLQSISISMCQTVTKHVEEPVLLQVRKTMWTLFQHCPTPEAGRDADVQVIEKAIMSCGLYRKRAVMFKRFCKEYLEKQVSIKILPQASLQRRTLRTIFPPNVSYTQFPS